MTRPRPIRTPFVQILDDFRRGPLTVMVWLLAVGAVAWLFTRRVEHVEFAGIARARQCEVSCTADGYLKTLAVDLYQTVEAGQIVAQLDDQLLRTQAEIALATIEQLKGELEAEGAKLRQEDRTQLGKSQADLAGIQAAEEKHHLSALTLKTQIETDRIDLQRLALDVDRMRKLLEAKACSQQEFDLVRLEHDEIARKIDQNILSLAGTEAARREVRRQRESYAGQTSQSLNVETMTRPLREAIRIQELNVEALALQRGTTLLRAPISGQVIQVLCQMGQAVRPGEPILLISERHAAEVVGYMAEAAPLDLRENMAVDVARAAQPQTVFTALISRIGPGIELLPQPLWPDLNRPRYGRPFLVSMNTPVPLIPGEKLVIRARR